MVQRLAKLGREQFYFLCDRNWRQESIYGNQRSRKEVRVHGRRSAFQSPFFAILGSFGKKTRILLMWEVCRESSSSVFSGRYRPKITFKSHFRWRRDGGFRLLLENVTQMFRMQMIVLFLAIL
ncbi:hypothetical protein TNCT_318051 [Trichonephila clavata]|uniref:Uncharacterized protein n=1 Tax=Trichonephila clavata TaxID=2740835 RepID=A0A8X6LNL0_TRICU|nr:hypothetical protein TNCT_318051 [Trichonephila clavata]